MKKNPADSSGSGAAALDAIYDADEFAALLKLPKSTFDEKVSQRRIVPIEIGPQTFRFNLRMNIAKWMNDARIPAPVIAAAFGFTPERKS